MNHSLDSIKIHRKQQNARRKFEARELLNILKSNPCKDCGEGFHHCQMDFVRENAAQHNISKMLIKSKSTIISEASKCVLLCANCARLRIYRSQRTKRARE